MTVGELYLSTPNPAAPPYNKTVLQERILAAIDRHGMFATNQRVGIAVSGGADSVFLLHALHQLAPRWNLHLAAVHIDHGIRGQASHEDAEFVRSVAAGFAIPFHLHTAEVLAIDDNLEQAARGVRHEFYARLISEGTLDRIATGHTRSDQAETVFYRLLRGSGLAGLAGIWPVTEEGLVRPLLDIDRAEIETWLRARNLAWREDASNRDLSFTRNRLRHRVLPALREEYNPKLDQAFAHLAILARDEELYWEREISAKLPSTPAANQPLILPTSLLTGSAAVARRMVRRAVELIRGDLRQIDFLHTARILEMAAASEGHDRVQLPGVDIMRSFEWIRFAPLDYDRTRERDFSIPLSAPGSAELPGHSTRITLQLREAPEPSQSYAKLVDELDWYRLTSLPPPNGAPSGLELRNWRPGDQYGRFGQSRDQRIKELFQEFRVPLWERRNWPIITYNGTIIWSRRFGVAERYTAGPGTRSVLRVHEVILGEKPSRETGL
jgi:tRNA(Ile)-lysidine synthase